MRARIAQSQAGLASCIAHAHIPPSHLAHAAGGAEVWGRRGAPYAPACSASPHAAVASAAADRATLQRGLSVVSHGLPCHSLCVLWDRSLYVPDIIKVYVVVKVSVIIIAYVVINVCIIINTCKVYVYDNSRKVRNVYHTLE